MSSKTKKSTKHSKKKGRSSSKVLRKYDIPSTFSEDNPGRVLYNPGSLVWAKLASFTWWPGIIESNRDPENTGVDRWVDNKGQMSYNVTFFGDKLTYARVKDEKIVPYTKHPKFSISRKYKEEQRKAIFQAELANSLDIPDRLMKFSRAVLRKGKCPKAVDFGATIPDPAPENGQESGRDPPVFLGSGSNEEMDDLPARDMCPDPEIPVRTLLPVPDNVMPENVPSTEDNASSNFILDESNIDINNPKYHSYRYYRNVTEHL